MKNAFFSGTCTALITPFLNDQINFTMMERLLQRQIDAGIPAVVLGGTTGESPTLSDTEKVELYRRGKEFAGERVGTDFFNFWYPSVSGKITRCLPE